MRAGGYTLTLLATPRVIPLLTSLAEGVKGRLDLRRDSGFPAQSTLRTQLARLESLGAIAGRRGDAFPGALEYRITDSGRELLDVAQMLIGWLALKPAGPLEPNSDEARAAVKGLVDGWLARMLTPLADAPHSLTELDKRLSTASYPALERRLETLRLTELVEERVRKRGGTPYAPSDWLRRGVGPLALAARWEHQTHPQDAEPLSRQELESALRISSPLLALSPETSGECQLVLRQPVKRGKGKRILGLLEIERGKASIGAVYSRRKPKAWASGTADDWFIAMIAGTPERLRLSGDTAPLLEVLTGARRELFQLLSPTALTNFPKITDQ